MKLNDQILAQRCRTKLLSLLLNVRAARHKLRIFKRESKRAFSFGGIGNTNEVFAESMKMRNHQLLINRVVNAQRSLKQFKNFLNGVEDDHSG